MTRIDELNRIYVSGEFKTVKEAMEYCRLHGLDISARDGNLFQVAGALMDARKDQHKITRYACAKIVRTIKVDYLGDTPVKLRDAAFKAIANVNMEREE